MKMPLFSKIAVLVVCCYGVYAFVKQKLGTYMFLISEFVFFDFNEPLLIFFIDYIAIMILFGFIGKQSGILCKAGKKAKD